MKPQSLFRLLAVFIALAIGAILFRRLSRPAASMHLPSAAVVKKLTRLEISGPTGSFVFARSSSTWIMQSPVSYSADRDVLDEASGKLGDITLSPDVTNDPARYAQFEITDSSATHVRGFASASGGTADVDFFVGKEGSDYGSFYVRFPGKPGVMEASGVSSHAFNKLPGEWLDKAVLPAGVVIAQLSVKNGGKTVRLMQKGPAWFAGGSSRAISTATVQSAISPAIQALSQLQADRLLLPSELPSKEKTGLSNPEFIVEISFPAPENALILKFGKKDERGYRYLEKSGENRVYFLVSDWKLESLRKSDFAKIK